jgi:hypothetical protein
LTFPAAALALDADLPLRAVCLRRLIACSLRLLVEHRFFDDAYDFLHSISAIPARVSAFIDSAYFPALSRGGVLASLEKCIKHRDPTLSQTRDLWSGLAAFLSERRMLHHLFHVNYETRRHLEDAAAAALELFALPDASPHRRLAHLSHALFCLTEAVHFRTHPHERTLPPFRPRDGDGLEDVERLLALARFMQDAVQFCIDAGVPFRDEYNAFRGSECAVELAAALTVSGAEDRAEELCRIAGVDKGVVRRKACRSIAAMPTQQLVGCVRRNRGVWGDEVYGELLKCSAVGENPNTILVVIAACWPDYRDQCVRFIEYGYLTEAFSCAMAYGLVQYVPLIAYRASQIADVEIVRNCEKILA